MKHKIQSLRQLCDEMVMVARGERAAPADAGAVRYESAEAVARVRGGQAGDTGPDRLV